MYAHTPVNARDVQWIAKPVLHDRTMLDWVAKVPSISSISSKKLHICAYTVKHIRTLERCILCFATRNARTHSIFLVFLLFLDKSFLKSHENKIETK